MSNKRISLAQNTRAAYCSKSGTTAFFFSFLKLGKMGKWTDKLYITHSEWSGEVGQHSASTGITGHKSSGGFKRLPFYCCSLSLQPFEHPVCTPEGIVFDLVNIIPYIKKYGTNPVTGEKLEAKNLIKLNFFKNDKDEYYCPVTYKVFSDHTAIAAIKTSGNVFAYDTIEKLNIKAKHWKDLLTDEPFTRKDIIMIQVMQMPFILSIH